MQGLCLILFEIILDCQSAFELNKSCSAMVIEGKISFFTGKYKSIHDAVKAGDVVELELRVKSGCSLNQIDSPKTRFTPLHWAAYVGSLEVRSSTTCLLKHS